MWKKKEPSHSVIWSSIFNTQSTCNNSRSNSNGFMINKKINTNRLLTEHEGRTREYWPRANIPQARLVSSLLYGILAFGDACFSFYIKSFQIFSIIKLAWRMFVFFNHFWNFGKISIFLSSSGSFTLKNDNIHSFFFVFAVLVANFEFACFAPKQKYTAWTVSMETVRTAKLWLRKNQSEHRDLTKTVFAM